MVSELVSVGLANPVMGDPVSEVPGTEDRATEVAALEDTVLEVTVDSLEEQVSIMVDFPGRSAPPRVHQSVLVTVAEHNLNQALDLVDSENKTECE